MAQPVPNLKGPLKGTLTGEVFPDSSKSPNTPGGQAAKTEPLDGKKEA